MSRHNTKVYDFINNNVDNEYINQVNKYKNINAIRFYDCNFSPKLEIPENINLIIFENTKHDFTNIPITVKEIWIINSNISFNNLPFCLEHIKISGKYNIEQIKIPFGATVEYIKTEI